MREKQKLVEGNTCTPAYDPQVRSSVTLPLKRRETVCDQSLKTPSNNPHADLQSGMTGRDLKAPVINMRNEPLITCVKSINNGCEFFTHNGVGCDHCIHSRLTG